MRISMGLEVGSAVHRIIFYEAVAALVGGHLASIAESTGPRTSLARHQPRTGLSCEGMDGYLMTLYDL